MTTSFAVIGGGKLGTAMGKQLVAAGYRITGVCCRTAASALRAAAVIGTEKAVTEPGAAADGLGNGIGGPIWRP